MSRIPPAVADLYRSASVGDPVARARVRRVVQGAIAGDPGAVAMKRHLDGLAAVDAATVQAVAEARQGGRPIPVRISPDDVGSAIVVPPQPLSRRREAAARLLGATSPNAPAHTVRPLEGLQSNQRGQSVRWDSSNDPTIYSGPNTITVAQCRSSGDDAEVLSVTLGLSYEPEPPSLTAHYDPRITGTITWGIGGASFATDFDWLNGTVLDVAANFIRVDVSIPNQSTFSTKPVFVFSAAFAYGAPTAQRNRARLTSDVGALSNGASSSSIAVPPFAVGVNVQTSQAGSGGPIDLLLEDGTPNLVQTKYQVLNNTTAARQTADSLPIPNGARRAVVTNSSGADIQYCSLIWELVF